jgi:hypothetical protein
MESYVLFFFHFLFLLACCRDTFDEVSANNGERRGLLFPSIMAWYLILCHLAYVELLGSYTCERFNSVSGGFGWSSVNSFILQYMCINMCVRVNRSEVVIDHWIKFPSFSPLLVSILKS